MSTSICAWIPVQETCARSLKSPIWDRSKSSHSKTVETKNKKKERKIGWVSPHFGTNRPELWFSRIFFPSLAELSSGLRTSLLEHYPPIRTTLSGYRESLLAPGRLVMQYVRVSSPEMRTAGGHKLCRPYRIMGLSWPHSFSLYLDKLLDEFAGARGNCNVLVHFSCVWALLQYLICHKETFDFTALHCTNWNLFRPSYIILSGNTTRTNIGTFIMTPASWPPNTG